MIQGPLDTPHVLDGRAIVFFQVYSIGFFEIKISKGRKSCRLGLWLPMINWYNQCRFTNMKLTKSADFALRIVIYLASPQGKGATMPLLAETLSIPYNNLSKIVQALAKAQVLQTRQGKNGGVALLRRPDQISLKTVIDVIDGPTRLTECLVNKDFCSLNGVCQLKSALGDVQRQIDTIL